MEEIEENIPEITWQIDRSPDINITDRMGMHRSMSDEIEQLRRPYINLGRLLYLMNNILELYENNSSSYKKTNLQKELYISVRELPENPTKHECSVCYNETPDMKNKCEFNCSHSMCNCCLKNYIENYLKNSQPEMTCHMCRKKITSINVYDNNIKTELENI